MSEITAGTGDKITLGGGSTVLQVLRANGGSQVSTVGLPFATEVRMAIQNTGLAWYEFATYKGSYAGHPAARDWNLESMGNTDLGQPLAAPFAGLVITAADIGGRIGRVVQLLGIFPDPLIVVWAGWHLKDISVVVGQVLQVGDAIGTIGNADGQYSAHLHEQIAVVGGRKYLGIPSPSAFTTDSRYEWVDPLEFYPARGVDPALVRRMSRKDAK